LAASRRELFMKQRPERNPRALHEAMERAIKEKYSPEKVEEEEKQNSSLYSLISDRTPPKRPK
jgi:hypothetical protein